MEIWIDMLKFNQELLKNGLIAWNIIRKKYKKECFYINRNVKT